MAPLTTRLGVGSEVDEGMMVADLRSAAAAAALEDIRGSSEEGMSDEVRRAAVLQYEGFLAAQEAMGRARRVGSGEGVHDRVDKLDAVLRRASDVERSVVLSRRRHGEVTAAAADEVMRDIEARAVRDAR